MIKQIRTSKFTRFIAFYLAIMIFVEMTQPMRMYALTGGPSQPEFESFTPIGTSDMVDLASGDFNYNIPIMDVGGYPLNLAYNSGVTMDQEASWVGLGWDLNVGQISRQMRGLPDDFNGDQMIYENNMKDNVTIGSNVNVFISAFGVGENKKLNPRPSAGIGIKYNNYDGFGFSVSHGLSYQINDELSVGMNMESSASEGVSVSPSVSFHSKHTDKTKDDTDMAGSLGVSYNSRKGVESMTISSSRTRKDGMQKARVGKNKGKDVMSESSFSDGGSLSFIDASFTPTKRVGMVSRNFIFNLNLEGELWGLEGGAKFSGYRTSQGVKKSEKYKIEKGYGFENTYNAGESDVLDFNREKDRTFNKNTTSLPITNNTYDLYSIQGQGVSGMYRPYRSQVNYVYDNRVKDDSFGADLGLEFGAGGGVHWGFDASVTIGKSKTSVWDSGNPAINRFKESGGNKPDYEKVFFKNIGGTHVDTDFNLFTQKLGGYDAIKLGLDGAKFSRNTKLNYTGSNGNEIAGTGVVKRTERLKRNQSIQKLTRKEAQKYGFKTQFSPYSIAGKHDHHTSEIRILKDGGDRYVYGRAAYNGIKKEVTFDVSDKDNPNSGVDCKKGLVYYNPGKDNSPRNSRDGDQYFNRVTTPAYAHSYLLTSVLSSDYQDLSGNGPSDDDLGTYTKFEYDNKTKDKAYKWRVPFSKNMANYDEGLRSSKKDNKGNYLYGEKELLYIKKIETKTHVAIFHITERKDGFGVENENGGLGVDSKMYKLNKISLYSKPEYLANPETATPIKEAHFVYDYSLCQGIDNNSKAPAVAPAEIENQGGKLTLKKVFFTYKKSNMGRYTPYVFNYGYNPSYDMKAYDMWGNYKPTSETVGCGTSDALSNSEFPYVDQSNRDNANLFASAWLLKSIEMPSGGKMELNYESDDYAHVQDKDVMEMFKVVGTGRQHLNQNASESILFNNELYNNGDNFLYIQLDDANVQNFHERYIKPIENEPIYFRFLLNMADPTPLPGMGGTDKYDFVTGYLNIKDNPSYGFFQFNGKTYASIPIEMVDQGDGIGNPSANPISKAGWYFGRQNLNRIVHSMHNEEDTNNLKGVVMELIGWIPTMFDIFKSPNGKLKEKGIASKFISGKSWIRLLHPEKEKIGGGSRIKEIKIHDQWHVMTNHLDEEVYKQFYGQKYSYKTEEGKTSGVATYEPLGGKENPFVEPFYDRTSRDLLLGPESQNYIEKPLGESFFPSPKITYSRVTVKNLPREKMVDQTNYVVKKHATGEVVTEFYTSYNYPTIVDYTVLSAHYDKSDILSSLLKINVKDHLTMSQGFSVHTNDMDGKMKNQRVYAEGQTTFISGVDYNYSEVTDNMTAGLSPNQIKNIGKLNNNIKTIDSKGKIESKLVGVDYDVINDFRDSQTITHTPGIHFNTAGLPLFLVFIIVPIPIPSYSKHESLVRTAVTTKVMHTTGILSEKVAYDAGSKVATKNLAWDAETGEVLLTETTNEYDDKYYNFNFPAYWNYDGMRQAAKNIDLKWQIKTLGSSDTEYQFDGNFNESDYLIDGDELWISGVDNSTPKPLKKEIRAWAVKVSANKFKLIDEKGLLIGKSTIANGNLKIIRSGHRNMQMASMASITSIKNPFINNGVWKTQIDSNLYYSSDYSQYKIINASAIEYSDIWAAQCECNLPKMVYVGSGTNRKLQFEYESTTNSNDDPDDIRSRSYNPFLYNILGNWRANKSYAYLTGRNYTQDPTPRKTGFFNDFMSFYVFDLNDSNKWQIHPDHLERWTYASEVTQYNPFGQEVENMDALFRYSSALFGYNNRIPVAVASNTKYNELAFDGFEDYNLSNCIVKSHFNFLETLEKNAISISNKQAHTGRKSIRIEPLKKAAITKKVVSCPIPGNPIAKTNKLVSVKKIKAVKK